MANFLSFIEKHNKISIIQAENPDGDSLSSAGALREILTSLGKTVSLYCPVHIPNYLHYLDVATDVSSAFDFRADAYIIVDTASTVLLSKLLETADIKRSLENSPVFVFDHHATESDLTFSYEGIIEEAASTTEVIYRVAKKERLEISPITAGYLATGLLSDTLGLSTESVGSEEFRMMAELVDLNAPLQDLEKRRRELGKRSERMMRYKARLMERTEFYLDGKLALCLVPFEEIQEFSDEYNPNTLILDELRFVQGVEVAVSVKTYPDGRITGKIRSEAPIAESLAGFFGGGGHLYASGFRIYDTSYEEVRKSIVEAVAKLLDMGYNS